MTAEQRAAMIGQKVEVSYLDGMRYDCVVIDHNGGYGHDRFQVEPVAGKGKVWVDIKRITRLSNGNKKKAAPRQLWFLYFDHWEPPDARGYSCFAYLTEQPNAGFYSELEGRKWLEAHHKGPDIDGVNAIFKILPAEVEG